MKVNVKFSKLGNIFFAILVFAILVFGAFQVFNIVYLEDDSFNFQVKNHLESVVDSKGERINDFFMERRHDAMILSRSFEVKEILLGNLSSSAFIAQKNARQKSEIIAKQVEIFLNRSKEMTLLDLQNDEEFLDLVVQDLGETGYTYLIDLDSQKIVMSKSLNDVGKSFDGADFVKINSKTFDDVSLGVGSYVLVDEFKTLQNVSLELNDYMERFKEIYDYYDVLLISPEGFVSYQVSSGLELGTNLNFVEYEETDLTKAYFDVKEKNDVVIYGPYLDRELNHSDLILSFLAPVYEGENFMGNVVLQSKMDLINEISTEATDLGETGEAFIIDKDSFLITPLRFREHNLLIQRVETENSKNCFEKSNESIITEFIDFKGDLVLGTYFKVDELGWCLVSEMNKEEVFVIAKQGAVKNNIFSILGVLAVVLFVGFLIMLFLNKRYVLVAKTLRKGPFDGLNIFHCFFVAFVFLIVYFFVVSFLFNDFSNVILENIVSLAVAFIAFILICISTHLKNLRAKNFIFWGGFFIVVEKLLQVILQKTSIVFPEFCFFVFLFLEMFGILLLFNGFRILQLGRGSR